MPLPRFLLERTALIVVDVQEKLLPLIDGQQKIQDQCIRLIRGCSVLGVPIMVTEQYPKGLGPTVSPILQCLPPSTPLEPKLKFSAMIESVRRWLGEHNRNRVLLCGIETHVCILQSALDLIEAGCVTGVVIDAVGSRTATDKMIGLQRMASVGVVPMSVEMALLEMVHEAGTDRFKAMLPIVK